MDAFRAEGREVVADPWGELTATQLRVAELVGEGLRDREIGQRLCISHRTVQRHLYDIFRKLQLSSRTQLAAEIVRRSSTHRDHKK